MFWTVLVLAALVAAVALLFFRSGGQREEAARPAGRREPPRSSESLNVAGEEKCPRCGSTWWPGGLRCWQCGYDTRADDSES